MSDWFKTLAGDQVSSYLLVVCLVTLLVAVLIWQRQRTQRTIAVWLAAAVLGMLLGSVGSYAAMRMAGCKMLQVHELSLEDIAADPALQGMGGPPGMVGPPGGGAPKGKGGMGGPPAPRPKRELTTLVRKIELLSGDIAIAFSPQQAAAVCDCLKDIEKDENMSDDDAKAKQDKILAALDDGQKARLELVALPRPTRGRPGGPGGPGAGGPGGAGGGRQEEPANPFAQETEAKSLKTLRDRLTPKGADDRKSPKK